MTTDAPGRLRRFGELLNHGRHRFRRWRRGRPFWGGLLLMLGGFQLFLSTQLSLVDVEISFGSEGFLVVVLPAVLLLCGILLWVTPQHRYFYSIIGTLTAVYSLLGLNLGGWFLGMLLGVLGGALGFAWTPVASRPAEVPAETGPAEDGDRPTAELPPVAEIDQPWEERTQPLTDQPWEERTGPLTDEPPGQGQTAPFRAPRREPPAYLALVVPLLLTTALVAPAAVPSQICLPLLCPDPTESPSPTPPSPTPSPTDEAPPEPEPEPGEEPPDGEQQATPSPGQTPTPTPTPTPSPIPSLDPPPDQPLVAAEPGLMTADRLVQEDFLFEGITELPTAEGPVEVMQFAFSRGTATNFSLTTSGDEGEAVVTADPLVLAGDVTFFTSRFKGRALGVLPLTLTPDSPLLKLLELVNLPLDVFFTEVELELVFTHGAELTADGFLLSVT